jgi:hypothetical protein
VDPGGKPHFHPVPMSQTRLENGRVESRFWFQTQDQAHSAG